MSHPAYVMVAGGRTCGAEVACKARVLGRLLAEAGAVLVCGGMGGVMEAACAGAHEAGGITVGLLPGPEREDGNSHLTVSLPTGMGEGRNFLLVRAADAVVAVDGQYGTLSEIALALQTGKPVVGLATWSLSPRGESVPAYPVTDSPEEAVRLVLAAVGGRQ